MNYTANQTACRLGVMLLGDRRPVKYDEAAGLWDTVAAQDESVLFAACVLLRSWNECGVQNPGNRMLYPEGLWCMSDSTGHPGFVLRTPDGACRTIWAPIGYTG